MEIQDYGENGQPKNKNSKLLGALLIALLVLIIAAGIAIYFFVGILTNDDAGSLFIDPRDEEIEVAEVESEDGEIILPDEDIEEFISVVQFNGKAYIKKENIVSVLFLGIDTNTERRINMRGYRSDMVMICAVDTAANKATLISIPRDTYTTMYKVDDDTGEVEETIQDKINAAYAYGGGATKYSYSNAMACVEMFLERRCELDDQLDFSLDIPIYLYAGIDMDGIPKVASSVGGVEVTLERGLSGVGSKGQTVLLKYDNAVLYLTTRHGAGGDLDRARRQQKFMLSLAKTIKNMGAVDIILSLYDDLQRYVRTNLDSTQMLDLAKILMKTNIESIETITIPTKTGKRSGSTYEIHDESATLEILLDIYYEEVS